MTAMEFESGAMAGLPAGLPALDGETIVADARRGAEARRAARKEAWLKHASGAGDAGAA
jgi:hypothetical protein